MFHPSAYVFVSLIFFLSACQQGLSASQSTAPTPQASGTPMPGGGGFRQDCTPFTRELEKDLAIANPENKASLTPADLGVGSDAYLEMKFQSADQDKDAQLNGAELRLYLTDHNLAQICRKP